MSGSELLFVAQVAPYLGHFPAGWESPAYLRHLHGGLEWALTEDAEGI